MPETNLWRAVLAQAIKGAKIPYPSQERSEARRWFIFSTEDVALVGAGLSSRTEDVALVLELADLDPEAMREGLATFMGTWDEEDEASRLINMRRRRGRPRKAVSTSPAPCAKRRSKANARAAKICCIPACGELRWTTYGLDPCWTNNYMFAALSRPLVPMC